AIHHLSYYEALDRIPLGAATTVEFSGPFLIAAAGSRRAIDALWTCLAAAGVLLLTDSGSRLSAAGLGFAALAGCCWGGCILVAKRLAHHVRDGRGLALAVAWGALLSLPYGLAQGGTRLLPAVRGPAPAIAAGLQRADQPRARSWRTGRPPPAEPAPQPAPVARHHRRRPGLHRRQPRHRQAASHD
ncbi:MAG TPA: hypothetical protein VHZ03_27320, partial [Trebonia sp.]|nr:hypothetical protein [Trebonia sp.]